MSSNAHYQLSQLRFRLLSEFLSIKIEQLFEIFGECEFPSPLGVSIYKCVTAELWQIDEQFPSPLGVSIYKSYYIELLKGGSDGFRLLSEFLSIKIKKVIDDILALGFPSPLGVSIYKSLPHTLLFIRVKNSFCVGKLVFVISLYTTKSEIV